MAPAPDLPDSRAVTLAERADGVRHVQIMPSGVIVRIGAELRPSPRPGNADAQGAALVRGAVPTTMASRAGLTRSLRPAARPENLKRRTAAAAMVVAQPAPRVGTNMQGAVCGSRSIRGVAIAPVPGRIKGCGIASDAVKVSAVAGVPLTATATIDCTTARALDQWVETGVKPAVGRMGGGLASLRVVATYACRTRNNQPGAKVSEHGRGRAVDVAGFTLANGHELSVLKDWNNGTAGQRLRRMHKAACGPFGTVLGPEADRYHRDHFHLDTARYRSGSYCR
ncbi:MAG: extensin family protein [Celeribacter sp.]